MEMNIKYIKVSLIFSALLSSVSCTKLDTKPYSAIGNDLLYADNTIVQDAQRLVNTALIGFGNSEHTRYANASSGELINPYDGQTDGSALYMKRAYLHTWTTDENRFVQLWNTMYAGISKANVVLSELEALKNKPANLANIQAPIRTARAFFLFHAMDNFRNVPLDTLLNVDPLTIKTNSSLEVFNYIERELKQCITLLDEQVNPKGRFNKYVAYTLLAQLYLNSQIYTGTARWEDANIYCDLVINSGKYSLTPNYFDNFAATNSPLENILVSYKDRLKGQGNVSIMETVNAAGTAAIGISGNAWNAFVANADMYNLYDAQDKRKRMWLFGDQRVAKPGERTIDGQPNTGDLITITARKIPLKYTTSVPTWVLVPGATVNQQLMSGVRNVKYYPRNGATVADMPVVDQVDLENDYVIMRYADILLMKAECQVRFGNSALAIDPLNQVHRRAFGDLSAIDATLENIRDERIREFAWEAYGRRDNIRFEIANPATKYWSKARLPLKPDVDPDNHTMIFPIPDNILAQNPRLVQNPGY